MRDCVCRLGGEACGCGKGGFGGDFLWSMKEAKWLNYSELLSLCSDHDKHVSFSVVVLWQDKPYM